MVDQLKCVVTMKDGRNAARGKNYIHNRTLSYGVI